MWGEIKFWFSRYKTWIFVGLGLVLSSLVFILVSRFGADADRQMEQQASEVKQVEEVVQEQAKEVVGETEFAKEVQAIPTEQDITAFLDGYSEEIGGDGEYVTEEAYNLIEGEYGWDVRVLAEKGYIVSDIMSADQRVMIQLHQEIQLFNSGVISEEDLVSATSDGYMSVGVPKTLYEISKDLGQRIIISPYTYGVFDATYEPSDYILYSHLTDTGEVEMTYSIDEDYDLGDVSLVDGFVAKVTNEEEGDALYAYLIFKPNKKMTGSEYATALEGLDIQLNGNKTELYTLNEDGYGFLKTVNNILTVQFTDGVYYLGGDSGYSSEDEVALNVKGEEIGLTVAGIDFEREINAEGK